MRSPISLLAMLVVAASLIRCESAIAAVRTEEQRGTFALSANGTGEVTGSSILRVCNAYAYPRGIDVFVTGAYGRSDRERLTLESGPLPYKQCKDFGHVHLTTGNSLSFEVSTSQFVGSFRITHLPVPESDSLLMISVFRHDRMTTTADFSSHIFSRLAENGPQFAFIDAYQGTAPAKKFELTDQSLRGRVRRANLGSALTLNPGTYSFRMVDDQVGNSNATQSRVDSDSIRVWATAGQAYVAIRCGVQAFKGPSFAEEFFIFPAFGDKLKESIMAAVTPHSGALQAASPIVAFILAISGFLIGVPFAIHGPTLL